VLPDEPGVQKTQKYPETIDEKSTQELKKVQKYWLLGRLIKKVNLSPKVEVLPFRVLSDVAKKVVVDA